jgi:hypothetical protein
MITRTEFYVSIVVILGVLAYVIFNNDNTKNEAQIAAIEMRDSVYQSQRDSAIKCSLKLDIKSDSLQSVINTKDLQLKQVKEKYVVIKEKVNKLSADSSLSFFLRSITR